MTLSHVQSHPFGAGVKVRCAVRREAELLAQFWGQPPNCFL